MSNFMPLRQLIADLINTLLLAILKLTGGRASLWTCKCSVLVGVFACVIEERACGGGCRHERLARRRPSLIDIEYVFRAINRELRLKMTRLEACGRAVSMEVIVIIMIQAKGRVSRPRSLDETWSCFLRPDQRGLLRVFVTLWGWVMF